MPPAQGRLPLEIVETVDTLWQRALNLAAQAAKHADNAARERKRALTETPEQHRELLGMLERE